jgi:lipoprotein NlpI
MASDRALVKPVKQCYVFAYGYHACRDYLQARDGYNERDVAGHWGDHSKPYHDFWHFICDKAVELHNGGTFVMDETWKEGAEAWQAALVDKYLEAFGEVDEDGIRTAEFYVAW